jgi:hypothetical protein
LLGQLLSPCRIGVMKNLVWVGSRAEHYSSIPIRI